MQSSTVTTRRDHQYFDSWESINSGHRQPKLSANRHGPPIGRKLSRPSYLGSVHGRLGYQGADSSTSLDPKYRLHDDQNSRYNRIPTREDRCVTGQHMRKPSHSYTYDDELLVSPLTPSPDVSHGKNNASSPKLSSNVNNGNVNSLELTGGVTQLSPASVSSGGMQAALRQMHRLLLQHQSIIEQQSLLLKQHQEEKKNLVSRVEVLENTLMQHPDHCIGDVYRRDTKGI
eukprot:Tbor_TRINITY_DN4873_c0_g3::TRINITY_DN4873_c0_g3_i1::g.1501::m.1501